ncbi:low-density lipoprotein receptor-related protein 4-like isoform X2 [Sycon ciliatum]|uniref:low-density lipoprotein receptor-related protein 4-like isoform X2 n=1 Tax=Sycon ciliatum TaxID=27933 RepID=UPI0031F60B5E
MRTLLSIIYGALLICLLLDFVRLQSSDQFGTCSIFTSKCANGQCIPLNGICDNVTHCMDGSDEANCSSTSPQCQLHNEQQCADGTQCYNVIERCDNFTDCDDGSDEWNCTYNCDGVEAVQCPDGTCIPHAYVCDNYEDCQVSYVSPFVFRLSADEANCPVPSNDRCSDGELKCFGTSRCIRTAWLCDGEVDCERNGDESQSLCFFRCNSSEFRCINAPLCIADALTCDGKADCPDGSDEALASCGHRCSPDTYRCAGGQQCIDERLVCNGFTDCSDGSDEANALGNYTVCLNRFQQNESSLATDCTGNMVCKASTGPSCPAGYTLNNVLSGAICVDQDECSEPGACSQACVNQAGNFSCSCSTGYTLENGTICVPSAPGVALLVANEVDIRVIEGGVDTIVVPKRRSAVAVDYHYTQDMLFWVDSVTSGIFASDLQGGDARQIVDALLSKPEGIAVDWVHDRIYWTETTKGLIETSLLDGSQRTTLLGSQLYKPVSLAIDPCSHHLYWTDVSNVPRIERCDLDGSRRVVIHGDNLYWPTGLTLDLENRLMYFSDNKLHTIEVSSLDGSHRRFLVTAGLRHPFSLSQFAGNVYWSDVRRQTLSATNQFVSNSVETISIRLHLPTDVKVLHPLRQKTCFNETAHPCVRQCAYTCISTSDELGTCACPPGRRLLADNITCEGDPQTSVVFTASDGMRRLSLDSPSTSSVRSETPVVTFSSGLHNIRFADVFVSSTPGLGYIFMVDDTLNRVFRSNLDGSNLTEIISSGLGKPAGVAVDYLNENLYFADEALGRLYMTDFDGTRTRMWSNFLRPRSLAIWPERKRIFVTDTLQPRLQSFNLLAQDLRIVKTFDFDLPRLISLDKENSFLYCFTYGFEFPGVWRVHVDSGATERFAPLDFRSLRSRRGLAALGGVIYYTNQFLSSIYSMNTSNSSGSSSNLPSQRLLSDVNSIGDILLYPSPVNSSSGCLQDNGGCPENTMCTLVDLVISGQQFDNLPYCVCPENAVDCQEDVNECAVLSACGPDQNCTNTVGSFTCSGQMNECQSAFPPCPVHQLCIETPRHFYCSNCSATEFVCHAHGDCVSRHLVCDGRKDCMDGSDELRCDGGCPLNDFKCTDGECIPLDFRCDRFIDCSDRSDEIGCTDRSCLAPSEYTCANGDCYAATDHCDRVSDCTDGSDEWNCTYGCNGTESFRCKFGGSCIPPVWVCDGLHDCLDSSDEENCGSSTDGVHCIAGEMLCERRRMCIRSTWFCDQDVDCAFAGDEEPNCLASCDLATQFKCINSDTCVPRAMVCDGIAQCVDGSDEALPSCQSCAGGNEEYGCAANHRCIASGKHCDGVNDCGDWSDETDTVCPAPIASPCLLLRPNALVCGVNCFNFSATCCPEGYERKENGFCYDIDECSSSLRPCNQRCVNTPGSYTCSCAQGYTLLNGTECRPSDQSVQPSLLVANTIDIIQYSLANVRAKPLVANQRFLTSVDYHWAHDYLFWTDSVSGSIYRSDLAGVHTQVIIHTQLSRPSMLAVDWIHDNLYWTDALQGRIESSDLDGNRIIVLFSDVRFKPQAIAVAPCHEYLFWTDFGDVPRIERSYLDGTSRRAIHTSRLYWPSALTLDLENELVYWSDNKLHTIEYSRFDGSGRTLLLSLDVQHPFAMTVFNGYLYWADAHSQSVLAHDQWSSSRRPHVISSGLHVPSDIRLLHPLRQIQCPASDHAHCNLNCSYRCLPSNEDATPPFSCFCGPQQTHIPKKTALQNSTDQCVEELPTLVLSTTNSGLRRVSPTSHASEILAGGLRPVFMASAVFGGDPSTTEIYFTNLSGFILKMQLLGGTPVLVRNYILTGLLSIAVDWTTGHIFVAEYVGGRQFINLFHPDLGRTRVLITFFGRIQDIIIWPQRGRIFWTDQLRDGIFSANMDGSDVQQILRTNNPVALVLDYDLERFVWSRPAPQDTIQSASIQGTAFTTHLNTSHFVFGMTLLGNDLIWTNKFDETVSRLSLSNASDHQIIQRATGEPLLVLAAPSPYQLANARSVCSDFPCPNANMSCVPRAVSNAHGETLTQPVCLCIGACNFTYQGCIDANGLCNDTSVCTETVDVRSSAIVDLACQCVLSARPSFNISPRQDCVNETQCSLSDRCLQSTPCSNDSGIKCTGGSECRQVSSLSISNTGSSNLTVIRRICTCPPGYSYDSNAGYCLDASSCPPCGQNTVCVQGPSPPMQCQCLSGYYDAPCDSTHPCSNRTILNCVRTSSTSEPSSLSVTSGFPTRGQIDGPSAAAPIKGSVGLAVGIPLGVFLLAFLLILIVYMYRRRRLNAHFLHNRMPREHGTGDAAEQDLVANELVPEPKTSMSSSPVVVGASLLSMDNPMYDSRADDDAAPLAANEVLPTLDGDSVSPVHASAPPASAAADSPAVATG